MSIYAALIGAIAGICLGYALLFAFVGLRRHRHRQLNLFFALFAFAYSGTLFMGIAFRSQTTAEAFLAISRWDSLFLWLAFVALNWYVAVYTGVRSSIYLWGITVAFTVTSLAVLATPTLTFTDMPTLTPIPLPWNETIYALVGEENIWGTLFFLLVLITLGYILVAGFRQWRRGERQAAAILLGGMSWFVLALLYELGAEADLWVYIPFAETGFLGIAIALALQMANSVIRTEEALARHQGTLDAQVQERTAEVQEANQLLLEQERAAAAGEERRRLAGDLHDSVTQTLYSVSLVAAALPRLLDRDLAAAKLSANHLRNMTLGALAEMRTLLYELRPEAFAPARLSTLLQHAADIFTGQTNVPADILVQAEPHLSTEMKRALYRITQEALNNTAKHANASTVEIVLRKQENAFVLCIEDDGSGFASDAGFSGGMGMDIMRERAAQAGFDLQITAGEDAGTTITAIFTARDDNA